VAASGDEFTITRLRSGSMVRVSVTGELDIATVRLLREQFEREKQEDLDAPLVVDLRRLEFMDSSALGVLWRADGEHCERLRIVLSAIAARLDRRYGAMRHVAGHR
jgi:anti-anti-sigma factor